MVQFLPEIESGKNCPTSSGVTDEEGRFTLKIADGRDGAVVGKCRVTLAEAYSAPRYGNEDDSVKLSKPRKTVPASYAIPKPSGLSAEVKRDGGPIEIDIKAN